MRPQIFTLELAAWGLDPYEFRPDIPNLEEQRKGQKLIAGRSLDLTASAICEHESLQLRELLNEQRLRSDMQTEMRGLDWSLGVVDLRRLCAFQRRLSFHPAASKIAAPSHDDWKGLVDFAFGGPKAVLCDVSHDAPSRTVVLRSSNPNLHLRLTEDPSRPIAAHAGSPFFEVAHYAGRWFLRDGYHRAYTLLREGIGQVPSILVKARNLEELGAAQPHFFPEAVLLSENPPMVTDFLDDSLTIAYERPATITTLRITMAESITTGP